MSNDANYVRELSTQELGFVDLSTLNRAQIVAGAIFLDGLVDLQVLRERVARIVTVNPQYKCRIAADIHEPAWETDDEFQLDQHLVFLGRRFQCKEQLLNHAANMATVPFDGMPPWKIEVIALENGSQSRHVIVFYAHHALADGLEGLKLLDLLSDSPDYKRKAAVPSAPRRRRFAWLAQKIGSTVAVAHAAAKDFARRPISCPLTSPSHSSKRSSCHFEIPRIQVAHTKRKYATTTQSVLLTLVSQGLSSYCKAHGFEGQLRAVLPYGRVASDNASFSTNNHDIGFITLPSLNSDVGQEFKAMESELGAVRREKEAGVYPFVLTATSFLPRAIRRSIVHRWARQSNVLFSILPCSRRNVSVLGRTVASICAIPAIPPSQGISVGIAITRDTVAIVLTVDPQHVKDISELRKHVHSALGKISAAAAPAPVSTTKAGSGSRSRATKCSQAIAVAADYLGNPRNLYALHVSCV